MMRNSHQQTENKTFLIGACGISKWSKLPEFQYIELSSDWIVIEVSMNF